MSKIMQVQTIKAYLWLVYLVPKKLKRFLLDVILLPHFETFLFSYLLWTHDGCKGKGQTKIVFCLSIDGLHGIWSTVRKLIHCSDEICLFSRSTSVSIYCTVADILTPWLFSRTPLSMTLGTGLTKMSTTLLEGRLGLIHKRPNCRPTGTHPSPKFVLVWRSAS